MTSHEQLKKWMEGESVHDKEYNTCVPDFSCCKPELLADKPTRQMFYHAVLHNQEDVIIAMLFSFLAKAIEYSGVKKEIYIIHKGTIHRPQIPKGD